MTRSTSCPSPSSPGSPRRPLTRFSGSRGPILTTCIGRRWMSTLPSSPSKAPRSTPRRREAEAACRLTTLSNLEAAGAPAGRSASGASDHTPSRVFSVTAPGGSERRHQSSHEGLFSITKGGLRLMGGRFRSWRARSRRRFPSFILWADRIAGPHPEGSSRSRPGRSRAEPSRTRQLLRLKSAVG